MRILLIRTSALGDVVHALPVLGALRRGLPRARIAWIVEAPFSPLLAGHPDLDLAIPVRLREWRRRPLRAGRGVAQFLRQLADFDADVVLDLMGNHKAGLLAALTLCDRRIGPARRFRREPSSAAWISEGVEPRGEHVVDRQLSLLAPLGVPPAPADFGGDQLLREAPAAALEALAREPDRRLLVHPGAAWGNKRYPAEWWGEVAARLRASTGLDTWVSAGSGEEELAERVAAASAGAARAIAAPSLPFLAALLRGARLVLGGDTGPLHLAHALGTPVLCLMGPTDPARHGPYGQPEAALWRRLPCSFCQLRLHETKACLLEIPPRLVAERALARLT
jgi:heptosyltransferase-1